MAAAYRYASRPNVTPPPEIVAARLLARFGPQAVYGNRPMYYKEMRRMRVAEEIVNGYNAREHAAQTSQSAIWIASNMALNNILIQAEALAHGRHTEIKI